LCRAAAAFAADWLKDDSLDDPDLLPQPDGIAAEIVESLDAALDRFRKVAGSLLPSNGEGAAE
jgi:type I restriction enzyme M protein